nr:MAG TPA: hypothetical protein [Caudoviricetes sp.]
MVWGLQVCTRAALLQVPLVMGSAGPAGRAEQFRSAVDPDSADRGSYRPPLGDPHGAFRTHHLECGQGLRVRDRHRSHAVAGG